MVGFSVSDPSCALTFRKGISSEFSNLPFRFLVIPVVLHADNLTLEKRRLSRGELEMISNQILAWDET